MDVRKRDENGIIKIGVIELFSNGQEDAIVPFDMPSHSNDSWKNHASNVIKVIRTYVPNAEIHLVRGDLQGIEYLIEQGVTIINKSLAGRGEQSLDHLLKDKAFLVCAVGNDGANGESWSAQQDYWCGVGAVDSNLNPKDYSAYGENAVTTVAQMPVIDGVLLQGTSFASPTVVGLLAQWYIWYKKVVGDYPGVKATNDFIKLNSHDIWESGNDLRTGWGLLRLPKRFEGEKVVVTEGQLMATKFTFIEDTPVKAKEIDLLKAAEIIDGRLMAPFRGVGNAFSKRTVWKSELHQAWFL